MKAGPAPQDATHEAPRIPPRFPPGISDVISDATMSLSTGNAFLGLKKKCSATRIPECLPDGYSKQCCHSGRASTVEHSQLPIVSRATVAWWVWWLSNFATNESSGNPSFGPVRIIAQQKPLKHLSSAHMHVQMFPSHCLKKLCIRTTQWCTSPEWDYTFGCSTREDELGAWGCLNLDNYVKTYPPSRTASDVMIWKWIWSASTFAEPQCCAAFCCSNFHAACTVGNKNWNFIQWM